MWYFQKLHVQVVLDYADIIVVVDHADTTRMTTQILSENFEVLLQILKKQSGGKGTWVCNYLKIWKPYSIKKNLHVCLVNDYADTQFSNFAIEYLRENEKNR